MPLLSTLNPQLNDEVAVYLFTSNTISFTRTNIEMRGRIVAVYAPSVGTISYCLAWASGSPIPDPSCLYDHYGKSVLAFSMIPSAIQTTGNIGAYSWFYWIPDRAEVARVYSNNSSNWQQSLATRINAYVNASKVPTQPCMPAVKIVATTNNPMQDFLGLPSEITSVKKPREEWEISRDNYQQPNQCPKCGAPTPCDYHS